MIDIKSGEPFDLSKAYMIASGAPILPLDYKQEVHTPKALHDFSIVSEESFLEEMQEISSGIKLKTRYPGIKSLARIEQKANEEKGGQVDRIYDPLRIAFIADRPAQIKRALDFFSPASNSRVVDMIDQFAVPDEESRIRRAKIVYKAQSGLYTEVQIWSSKMLNAFEESHIPYEHQRSLKSALLNTTSPLPHKTYHQLSIREQLLGQTRRSIHDAAAAEAGLDKFIEKRTFGKVGDTPIVAIERPIDMSPTILRPDAKSGLYVPDNALYADFITGNYVSISRENFLRASHGIAIEQVAEMRRTGQKLPAPLAHFHIA